MPKRLPQKVATKPQDDQIHSQLSNSELAEFLADLTKISRPIIAKWFRSLPDVETKADASPVTIADRAVETALRTAIAARFPGDDIVGEEHSDHHGDGSTGFKWVIDPIDGTKAFISGKPIFGTLVGLLRDDSPVAGLCDMPMLDELYLGVGNEFTMNGKQSQLSSVTDLAKARIATTSPEAFSPNGLAIFNRISKLAAVTNYGGDCYNYALLGAGHIDLVVEDSLAPHDVMGVVGVMRAAGVIVTDFDGLPVTLAPGERAPTGSLVCAATPALHAAALAVISA